MRTSCDQDAVLELHLVAVAPLGDRAVALHADDADEVAGAGDASVRPRDVPELVVPHVDVAPGVQHAAGEARKDDLAYVHFIS